MWSCICALLMGFSASAFVLGLTVQVHSCWVRTEELGHKYHVGGSPEQMRIPVQAFQSILVKE